MSNKTSDKNVVNIEDNVMSQQAFYELIDSFEVVSKLTMYGRKSIKHYVTKMQAELEQKDKRIKELEEENSKTQIMSPYYVKENYIPKQVIIDKIEELKNNLKYIDCNRDCSECFNKEGKALYRGSDFDFCFAYYQIKGLQELLEGEK